MMVCDKVMDVSSFGDEKNVLFSEKNEHNVKETFFSAKRALVNGKERSLARKRKKGGAGNPKRSNDHTPTWYG